MKRKVTREDLHADAFAELSSAVDLFNTLEDEHFTSVDMPEGWGDRVTYERLSRKIRAVSAILDNAIGMLAVAEWNEADDYFNDRVELMADIISQGQEKQITRGVEGRGQNEN